MTVTMLNRGLYDGSEAARLLGVGPEQVIRWATPSASGRPAVVVPTFGRAFSFADLVALRVAVVVRLYLRHVEFSTDGEPERWRPAARVLLDPSIQAGVPCIIGTRVPTATIRGLLDEESPEDIALDFGITIDDVEAAARFEDELAQGFGLAA